MRLVISYWGFLLKVLDQPNPDLSSLVPPQDVGDELGLYLHLYLMYCVRGRYAKG